MPHKGSTPRGILGGVPADLHPVVATIIYRRVKLGISRESLAQLTGISRSTLDKLERSNHLSIGFDKMLSIFDVLELEIHLLPKEDEHEG